MYTKVDTEKKKSSGSLFKRIGENYKYMAVTYDLNFMKYVIYASIICMVFLGIILALSYKTPFVDPIGRIKGIFLSIQIGTAVLAIITIAALGSKAKSKDSLLKAFLAFTTLLLILILGQGSYLGTMVSNYNEKKFADYYEQYENNEVQDSRRTLSLSTSGVTSSTAKDDYIKTSKSSFINFVIRAAMLITLEIIIMVFALYVLYKLMNTQVKLEPVKKKITA